jgi:hypothetical protein
MEYITETNFTCFLFIFFNVVTNTFKITHVVCSLFLLDGAGLNLVISYDTTAATLPMSSSDMQIPRSHPGLP